MRCAEVAQRHRRETGEEERRERDDDRRRVGCCRDTHGRWGQSKKVGCGDDARPMQERRRATGGMAARRKETRDEDENYPGKVRDMHETKCECEGKHERQDEENSGISG